jgi:hypothetical protein
LNLFYRANRSLRSIAIVRNSSSGHVAHLRKHGVFASAARRRTKFQRLHDDEIQCLFVRTTDLVNIIPSVLSIIADEESMMCQLPAAGSASVLFLMSSQFVHFMSSLGNISRRLYDATHSPSFAKVRDYAKSRFVLMNYILVSDE